MGGENWPIQSEDAPSGSTCQWCTCSSEVENITCMGAIASPSTSVHVTLTASPDLMDVVLTLMVGAPLGPLAPLAAAIRVVVASSSISLIA